MLRTLPEHCTQLLMLPCAWHMAPDNHGDSRLLGGEQTIRGQLLEGCSVVLAPATGAGVSQALQCQGWRKRLEAKHAIGCNWVSGQSWHIRSPNRTLKGEGGWHVGICAREAHGPQPSSDSPFLLGQVLIFLMIPFLGFPRAAISPQQTGLTRRHKNSPHCCGPTTSFLRLNGQRCLKPP